MFNSVAKYLWGDANEVEQGYMEVSGQADTAGEQLDLAIHQDDDDWLVVGQPGKENEGHHPSHHAHPHQHHPHRHHHPHHHHHHHARPATVNDSHEPSALAQAPAPPGASDIELDEAASLRCSYNPLTGCSDSVQGALQDCTMNLNNFDLDSNYSSDGESGGDSGVRPSSPESVFSVCSGRSHATYRPSGSSHDPWIVAPPPCFTGSGLGELPTISSSPLENLLIEHPSMSVYLSVPPSSLPPSHPFHLAHLAGESAPASSEPRDSGDDSGEPGDALREDRTHQLPVGEQLPAAHRAHREGLGRHWGFAAPAQVSPAQAVARLHAAQRVQSGKSNKAVSRQKCRRENKVYEYKGCPKGNTKRSKRSRPSSCKSGRMCQRV
ncbi:E3 ubiquitin-protein ligase Arkadia [Aplysia californica]|uniref:E3 ubiquitin-protein ligase Arkadia n=1 Tax=Aplysia californica TaxID=6500 RepID=A0ABM0JR61_APLCA|nr:E3 ubiquitin-protein ligase Arkadia [Aplysia californica]